MTAVGRPEAANACDVQATTSPLSQIITSLDLTYTRWRRPLEKI